MNDDNAFGPEPPHDDEAEAAVLGALMLNNKLIDAAAGIVRPAEFFQPHNETIYSAILHLYGATKKPQIDPLTLAQYLREAGDLDRVGGPSYLHKVAHTVPVVGHVEHYAEIVRDCALLRTVQQVSLRSMQRARSRETSAAEVLDQAMSELQAAATGLGAETQKLSVADRWDDFLAELDAGHDPNALDTPWPDINDVIELKPGQLVTVGAATGGGKSLFGMNLASHVALGRKLPVLVASMEMGGTELLARLTAAEASVPLDRLIRRKLEPSDREKIARVSDKLAHRQNFILDDSPNLSLSKIRARMRWMTARDMPPAMVVADYLQLMTPEGSSSNSSRANEVALISRGLKLLAMEFEVPVVALAQFNRNHVGRQPVPSDFKDSSSIEQDSNVILLLHRPLAEDGTDTGPRAGEIDVIVAKNRNGAQGRIIPLTFQGHFARLRSMGRAA
jgi:replicative DNA helicase